MEIISSSKITRSEVEARETRRIMRYGNLSKRNSLVTVKANVNFIRRIGTVIKEVHGRHTVHSIILNDLVRKRQLNTVVTFIRSDISVSTIKRRIGIIRHL